MVAYRSSTWSILQFFWHTLSDCWSWKPTCGLLRMAVLLYSIMFFALAEIVVIRSLVIDSHLTICMLGKYEYLSADPVPLPQKSRSGIPTVFQIVWIQIRTVLAPISDPTEGLNCFQKKKWQQYSATIGLP